MNLSMTKDTIHPGSQAAVASAMTGWNLVAFQAVSVSCLNEQSIVGRTVRLMTLDTSAPFDQMFIDGAMLEEKRPRFVGMAVLTSPVKPDC